MCAGLGGDPIINPFRVSVAILSKILEDAHGLGDIGELVGPITENVSKLKENFNPTPVSDFVRKLLPFHYDLSINRFPDEPELVLLKDLLEMTVAVINSTEANYIANLNKLIVEGERILESAADREYVWRAWARLINGTVDIRATHLLDYHLSTLFQGIEKLREAPIRGGEGESGVVEV